MSENGPREGTRDLPRSGPDAGRRAVDSHSAAGAAYQSISRRARRRREEIMALVRTGLSPEDAARKYSRDHPLEPDVSSAEVAAVIATGGSSPSAPKRRPG